jgi:anti-sigma factor RsiW
LRRRADRGDMTTRLRTPVLAGLAAAAVLTLGACTSGGSSSSASGTTATTSSAGVENPVSGTKADANTASVSELTAALSANGVPNAGRWAREVEEYRPYPTNDPTFTKLQQNLAKYNPGDDVVEKIIGALSL